MAANGGQHVLVSMPTGTLPDSVRCFAGPRSARSAAGCPSAGFATRTSEAEPVFERGPEPSLPASHSPRWLSPGPADRDGFVAA